MVNNIECRRQPNGHNSLQKQVSVMSMNLSAKLDELQRGDRHMETTVALCEIRTQLQELTKSVESCQSEVSEVSVFSLTMKVAWNKGGRNSNNSTTSCGQIIKHHNKYY